MKREEFRKRLLKALFDSKEQLLLDNWMKQTPFYQIDLNRATEKEYQNEINTSYQIANIALSMSIKALPNWGLKQRISSDQRIQSSMLESKLLLEINWASSASGIDWPERYYVTYLPGYDIHIVTLSNDSADIHGYTDLALGFYKSDKNEVNLKSAELIMQWWLSLKQTGQDKWCEVTSLGLIKKNDLMSLRDRVWK